VGLLLIPKAGNRQLEIGNEMNELNRKSEIEIQNSLSKVLNG